MKSAMDSQLLTRLKPIEVPDKKILDNLIKKGTKGEKLRHFEIVFASDRMMQINNMMRRFDLWHDRNAIEIGEITSYNTLPLHEYKYIIAWGLTEAGGELFSISEIDITTEQGEAR
jgi:hypothetical protein